MNLQSDSIRALRRSTSSLPAALRRAARLRATALATGAALLLGGLVMPLHAAVTSTTFNVTATVLNSCSVTATDLAFGSYDPASATDKQGASTITVNCTLGTAYDFGLNNGTNASGSTRRMASGAARLSYQVYKDVAGTQVLGAVSNALGVTGIGTGVGVPLAIYGVIPKTQNVTAGSYSDVIIVTVDY